MAASQKILKALKSALTYTESSVSALDKKDESLFEDTVWHVAAELEYALFLFSIVVQDDVDKSKWKLNPKIRKVEGDPILVKVQDLLNASDKFVRDKKFLDAFKSVYLARNYVLAIQKDLAKKKREALRKKK